MIRQLLSLVLISALAGCSTPVRAVVPNFALPPATSDAPMAAASPDQDPAALAPRMDQVAVQATARFAFLQPNGRTQRVVVVNAATGLPEDVGVLPPWEGPGMPHVSADGHYLIYDGLVQAGPRVVLWDLTAHQPVAGFDLPGNDPQEADLDGTGRQVVYLSGAPLAPVLMLFDRATGAARQFTLPKALRYDMHAPTLAGDASRLAFVMSPRLGDLCAVVLDVASGRAITPTSLDDILDVSDPALGPDGAYLVFSSKRLGVSDLLACQIDTGSLRDLSCCEDTANETWPRFFGSDGGQLAYLATDAGVTSVRIRPFTPWR